MQENKQPPVNGLRKDSDVVLVWESVMLARRGPYAHPTRRGGAFVCS